MQRTTKEFKRQKLPVKTNVGTFVLEMSRKGLYAVRFPAQYPAPRPGLCLQRPGLYRVALRFREYFKNPSVAFVRVQLDFTGYTPFQRKVYGALRKVPAGKVITYGELAKRAGYPGAARAAGAAMKKNRLPVVIPCHRVIPASVPIPINFREAEIGAAQTTIMEKKRKVWTGGLGEYSAGRKWKRWLLEYEEHSAQGAKVKAQSKKLCALRVEPCARRVL